MNARPTSDPPQPSYGWRVARVGGIPVYLGRSLLLLVLVVVVVNIDLNSSLLTPAQQIALCVAYAAMLIGCVLWHEAAHAVAARAFGFRVDRVVADVFGGHTVYEVTRAGPTARAMVAIAGPFANALLAVVAYLLWQKSSGVPALVWANVAWINALLAVFNILPGLPLDGGQVVESIVWGVTGDRNRAHVVAGWCGRVVVVLIAGYFVLRPMLAGQRPDLILIVWVALIGAMLWQAASAAIAAGTARSRLAAVRVGAVISPTVIAPYAGSVATAVDALIRLGQPGYIVATDFDGRPVGLADPEAIESVPPEHRTATPLSAVTSSQPSTWVVHTELTDDIVGVVESMQESGAGVVVAVDAQARVLGVITAQTLNASLAV